MEKGLLLKPRQEGELREGLVYSCHSAEKPEETYDFWIGLDDKGYYLGHDYTSGRPRDVIGTIVELLHLMAE